MHTALPYSTAAGAGARNRRARTRPGARKWPPANNRLIYRRRYDYGSRLFSGVDSRRNCRGARRPVRIESGWGRWVRGPVGRV